MLLLNLLICIEVKKFSFKNLNIFTDVFLVTSCLRNAISVARTLG